MLCIFHVFDKIITGFSFNAYALCLFSGLREGECLGLSWGQVDLEKGRITVSQQLQKEKAKGGRYYIDPSTKSGKIVNIPTWPGSSALSPSTATMPSLLLSYRKRTANGFSESITCRTVAASYRVAPRRFLAWARYAPAFLTAFLASVTKPDHRGTTLP